MLLETKKGGTYLKRVAFIKLLEQNGWWLLRHGANHDIYTNGIRNEAIPRHTEINERLVERIRKREGI